MTHKSLAPVARTSLAALAAALMMLIATPAQQVLSRSPPAPLAQPTEMEMGVPLYPGAKFDGMNSAGMSQNERYYWLFTTTDPVEKVVAFFKEKTHLVPTEVSGSYTFALKQGDSAYVPDHGVTVEKNKLLPPPARTVITVIKLK
jgi:hypothetical protein